jgi:hypothetical protein
MKIIGKFITTAILICIIIICFLYIGLYYSFNIASENNPVNLTLRKKIIIYPFLRTILRLHQIGDARYDLASKLYYPDINIQVLYQNEIQLNSDTLKIVTKQIKRVIDVTKNINFADPIILDNLPEELSDQKLNELLKIYTINDLLFKKITLYVFVLNRYSPSPTYAGLVKNDNSIFIFKAAIQDVSDRQSSSLNTEVSTILHEFGHLLGANHIQSNDCILSNIVENSTYFNLPSIITNSYCNIDIEEIKSALSIN